MPETQLANPRTDIRATLIKMQGEFRDALPKLLTPERFTRVALTCINKNPKLLECTRESLLACLLDCAMLGIEPDGRRAHLIPYGNKCTLILDYKGIAELVRRSGEISTLHCGIVYPSDDFDYAFGTGQFLKHRPTMNPHEGEKPLCVYSYVKLKDGQEDFDVMSIEDVERIRKRSRSGNNGPWVTDFDEMAKKTVFRRHSKWLPLSPELRDKIEKDDEPLTEQERFAAAKPVAASNIEFGEALPPEKVAEPEQPIAEERKRHRRTKAEMEAARAQEGVNPGPDVQTAPAPATATPLEGLRNLMATSKIEEKDLLVFMFSQLLCEQGDTLESIPPARVQHIISNWVDIATAIQRDQ